MLEELLNAFSTPGQTVGHFTYGLLVVSMVMRNMTWLRMIAILSGVLAIFYRVYLVPDSVSVVWESAFVLVNVVQLTISWVQHLRARFTPEEADFLETIVPILPRGQAFKLMRIGQWRDFAKGVHLTEEGKVVPELMFIVAGTASIETGGQVVAVCRRGDFVGEMSFVSRDPASADAIAAEQVRCLCFDRGALQHMLEREPAIRNALDAGFSRNLIEKLAKSNLAKLGRSETASKPT